MRTNWFIRLLIFLLIAAFFYFLLYAFYPQLKAINNQQPNRPSVSETINRLDNGRDAQLDKEDYEDGEVSRFESTDETATSIKEGARKAKNVIVGNAKKVGDKIEEGADKTGKALQSAGQNIKEKTKEVINNTPSIDDLVALKEEQAKKFERQEDGSTAAISSYNDSSTPSGDYMVVAGTYRQMINAESELKKLKKLGYVNASIAKFNNSTYASLIVDRFATSDAAYQYAKSLKNKGLEVYVHKKR